MRFRVSFVVEADSPSDAVVGFLFPGGEPTEEKILVLTVEPE